MFLMLQERGGGGQARRALAYNRAKISLLTKHGEGAILLNRTLLVFTTPSATAGNPPR